LFPESWHCCSLKEQTANKVLYLAAMTLHSGQQVTLVIIHKDKKGEARNFLTSPDSGDSLVTVFFEAKLLNLLVAVQGFEPCTPDSHPIPPNLPFINPERRFIRGVFPPSHKGI
jgi:hypothetical protein